jgi:hypothetical protein
MSACADCSVATLTLPDTSTEAATQFSMAGSSRILVSSLSASAGQRLDGRQRNLYVGMAAGLPAAVRVNRPVLAINVEQVDKGHGEDGHETQGAHDGHGHSPTNGADACQLHPEAHAGHGQNGQQTA